MSLRFTKRTAFLEDSVSVEDAEPLLAWLLENRDGGVNLARCDHFHAAVQNVLVTLQPKISAWPRKKDLKADFQAATKPIAPEISHG
tara:strand:- start:19408 stop:19668 length:261 start_codon:yes stop_codon:yes gene_type:complete